jgi:hypothetical protein
MSEKEIKKSGNKIYALAHKIEECRNSGMESRVPDYLDQLEKVVNKLHESMPTIKSELDS